MNLLNNRIDRIENIVKQKSSCIYPADNDKFIESLGVNPKDYELNIAGVIGYDYLRALETTAIQDWA